MIRANNKLAIINTKDIIIIKSQNVKRSLGGKMVLPNANEETVECKCVMK